jgi:hypothetical protein
MILPSFVLIVSTRPVLKEAPDLFLIFQVRAGQARSKPSANGHKASMRHRIRAVTFDSRPPAIGFVSYRQMLMRDAITVCRARLSSGYVMGLFDVFFQVKPSVSCGRGGGWVEQARVDRHISPLLLNLSLDLPCFALD